MTSPPDPDLPESGGGSAPRNTATGLAPNVAGALAYLLGPLTGILFLVLEKENPFVRFHAAQSIGVSVVLIVAGAVLSVVGSIFGMVPVLGWLVAVVLFLVTAALSLAGLGLWLLLMFMAFQGEEWELPWVGEQSRRLLLGSGA